MYHRILRISSFIVIHAGIVEPHASISIINDILPDIVSFGIGGRGEVELLTT